MRHTRLFQLIKFHTAAILLIFLTLGAGGLGTVFGSGHESITGTINETMNASGYTYLSLNTSQGSIWVAIPQTTVKVGDEITCAPGMIMKDFQSKTLNRTFASIIFSPGIVGAPAESPHTSAPQPVAETTANSFEAAVQAEQQASGTMVQPEQSSGGSMGAIAPFTEISVEKATGENSYTVGELFDKAAELDGKTVRVRGKVVKFNANIMGRNWLHLQDGSGNPMKNTHDLVVTTTAEVGSPDVLVIEGKLAANKDFGAGYKYDVILEQGKIIQ